MTTFADLGLSPTIVETVANTGYTNPTPIQEQAIPVALAGRDVLGIAQTGTGKTAAFTLPMIDRLSAGRSKARMPRSLVLAPTRELADQVASSFEKYAAGGKLTWALLIGGVSFEDQLRKLDRGVDVLIATPGRLLDHFERGKLLLTGVQIMVVDEADRMLDMGFIPDIERIFKMTPASRQTLFFSATMPPEITRLTTQFLKDPTRIEATRPATTADTISQYVAPIPISEPKAKRMALRALISQEEVGNGIVFCNRKTDVDIVAKSLKAHGFDAAPIHGDLEQSMRMKTLDNFRKGELKLLVASDVAARGLDIPAVSHVFNYDVPFHADDYVHRIGRTGRAGRTGKAFMILAPNDAKAYDKVLKLTKKEPEAVVLDLDWSLAAGGDGERRGRSGSGRSGGRRSDRSDRAPRGPRGKDAPSNRAPEDAASTEPFRPAPPPVAADEAATPKPVSRSRSRTSPAASEPTPAPSPEIAMERAVEPAAARMRPVRGVRESAPRDPDDGHSVVGFGADVPAFLARVTPLPAPSKKTAGEDDDD
jgi:superfamily II DNA/RNA helicase